MSSIRKLKRKFFRRQWFSSAQIWVNEETGRVTNWPMKRHGLRYDDIRARTGVRRSPVGQMELIEIPYDEMVFYHKECKKKDQADTKDFLQDVRNIRKNRLHPVVHASFRIDVKNCIKMAARQQRALADMV